MNIGFIGLGNMGFALYNSILKNDNINSNQIYVYDTNVSKLESVPVSNRTKSCEDLFDVSNIVFLTIKPNCYKDVLEKLSSLNTSDKLLITVAPGIELSYIESFFKSDVKVVRTMPNTPVFVGEGMIVMSPNKFVTDTEIDLIKDLLKNSGKIQIINEKLMDISVAVSGSSPAYVYMLIDAIADGAVVEGMSKDLAIKLAAQTVLGSAKMVLETNEAPSVLKDKVCSPGGTTIEAVAELQKKGFVHSIISAVKKCKEKASSLKL